MATDHVTVIGGGLAGSEAAFQLAARGVAVTLCEMRPNAATPAHHSDRLAELVCSNSLKSQDPVTAPGMLKRELAAMGSLLLSTARSNAVPAGSALAVDREAFAASVTARLTADARVEVVRSESGTIPEGPCVIATGPLSSPALEPALAELVGTDRLAFYDAAAPIVDGSSIDESACFRSSRYGKGQSDDYVNCPMDRPTYERFVAELLTAERVEARDFESNDLFNACQPIEEIARSGMDAPRFGPLRPVGLHDPATGRRPWAVLQLRAETVDGTAFGLVGLQTNLTFGEQRRVFSIVPALRDAEFLRYGVMHRNTFIDSPRLLDRDLSLRSDPRVSFAGQIVGTEGYLEAAGTGLVAALGVIARLQGLPQPVLPRETALGALVGYATDPETSTYQPMHVNFGILPALDPPVRSRALRRAAMADRAGQAIDSFVASRPDLRFDVVRQATGARAQVSA